MYVQLCNKLVKHINIYKPLDKDILCHIVWSINALHARTTDS